MSVEHFSEPERKEMFTSDGNMLKRHRSQLKGAPSGQIWENLSIKINAVTVLST